MKTITVEFTFEDINEDSSVEGISHSMIANFRPFLNYHGVRLIAINGIPVKEKKHKSGYEIDRSKFEDSEDK